MGGFKRIMMLWIQSFPGGSAQVFSTFEFFDNETRGKSNGKEAQGKGRNTRSRNESGILTLIYCLLVFLILYWFHKACAWSSDFQRPLFSHLPCLWLLLSFICFSGKIVVAITIHPCLNLDLLGTLWFFAGMCVQVVALSPTFSSLRKGMWMEKKNRRSLLSWR